MISGTYGTKWFDEFVVFGDFLFYFFSIHIKCERAKSCKKNVLSLNHVFLRGSSLFLLFTFQLEFVLHLSLELRGADEDRGMDKKRRKFSC